MSEPKIYPSVNDVLKLINRLNNAIEGHDVWMSSFCKAVLCLLPFEEFIDNEAHYKCNFGQWYYSKDNSFLREFSIFSMIGESHVNMHRHARDLILEFKSAHFVSVDRYDNLMHTRNAFLASIHDLDKALKDSIYDVDSLTRVYGCRKLIPILSEEAEQIHSGTGKVCYLCLICVNNIKHINATYGRKAGDEVLKHTAYILASSLSPLDTVFRYRGHAFLVSMPETCQINANDRICEMSMKLQECRVLIGDDIFAAIDAVFRLFPLIESLEDVIEEIDKAVNHFPEIPG